MSKQVQKSLAVPAVDTPLNLPLAGPPEAAAPGLSRALARVLSTAQCQGHDVEVEECPQVITEEDAAGKTPRKSIRIFLGHYFGQKQSVKTQTNQMIPNGEKKLICI